MPRDHLFVSYAGEDWVFADWLALKLAAAGYNVWYDRIKLLGGESYPRDIDDAIKNRTFRLVAVISRNSLNKPNPLKERTLGLNISKERGIDFVIPLYLERIEAAELQWMISDLTYIPFYRSWSGGLRQLLSKLESQGAPRDSMRGTARVEAWLFQEESAAKVRERVWSNLLPLLQIPDELAQFKVPPKSNLEALAENWCFFRQNDTTLWAFVPPSPDIGKKITVRKKSRWNISYEEGVVDLKRVVVYLVRRHLKMHCTHNGLKVEDGGDFVYFPQNLLAGDKIHFSNFDGKSSWVQVVGERQFRSGLGTREKSRYHLAMVFNPLLQRHPIPVVQVGLGLHLTDLNGVEFPSAQASRRRKAIGKTWWNYQWMTRVLACSSWIAGGRESVTLASADAGNLVLGGRPISLEASDGIDEPKLAAPSLPEETAELDEEEEPGPYDAEA